MPRPRDSQRSRLYRAERCLPDCDRNLLKTTFGAQAWLDTKVLAQRWFRARWQLPGGVQVRPGRGGASSYGNGGYINLGVKCRNPAVILHELAHQIIARDTPTGGRNDFAAHGPEFAAVLLYLVGQVMGKESAEKLRAAYAEYGVKHRTGARAVPGLRYPVTTQAAIRRNRQARADQPLTSDARTLAADIIRRAIRGGEFGKAGSKTRTHALAVARTLVAGS